MKILLAVLIAAFTLALTPVVNAKSLPQAKAPPSGATVSVDQASLRFGDTATFTVSEKGYLNVLCSQSSLVMNSWASYLGGSGQVFGLYSPVWKSGGASCSADLYQFVHGKLVVVASTSFAVAP